MAAKPEQKMWDYLSNAMRGYWDAQRHEDRFSNAIPDVSFAMLSTDGWIELKTIREWPKRASTAVRVHHLDSGQVNWLEARGAHGNGACWLLLAVGPTPPQAEWFLIPWYQVRDLYDGKMTRGSMAEAIPFQARADGLRAMITNAVWGIGVA